MKAIDDYIARLPAEQGVFLDFLRQQILAVSPLITERLAYGIPFFYAQKPMCYLNPNKNGVDVGFYFGNKLAPRPGLLVGERKMVRSIFFGWEDDIDVELLKELILESLDYIKRLTAK